MGFLDSLKANSLANKAYRLHAMGNQLLNTNKNAEAQKKHTEALEAYNQAYAMGARKSAHMLSYAILLMRNGEFPRAKEILLEVNKDPKLTKDDKKQLRIDYSICQWKLGNLDTAIETIRRAEQTGESSMIYTTQGIYLLEKAIQTDDFAEVQAYNAKAMEYDDEDAATLDNIGQTYLAMYNSAIAHDDKEHAAEYRAKAWEYFKKAHKEKETQVTTLYAMALLYHQDHDRENARKFIQAADNSLMSAICPVTREMIAALKKEIG